MATSICGTTAAHRYNGRGYCPVCDIRTEHSLDSHMMCHHLDLGQLWHCPVEWCAVWKGSVRECRDHFNEKHCVSETLDFDDKVSKSFPAWTVTRDFWERALKPEISGIAVDIRLFHESGRRLIPKYRVYQDPLPHPALREGRITKLISLVNRAMVIAQLYGSPLVNRAMVIAQLYGSRSHHQGIHRGKCQVIVFRRWMNLE